MAVGNLCEAQTRALHDGLAKTALSRELLIQQPIHTVEDYHAFWRRASPKPHSVTRHSPNVQKAPPPAAVDRAIGLSPSSSVAVLPVSEVGKPAGRSAGFPASGR